MVNTSPEVRSSLEPGAFSMPFSPLQQAAVRQGPHKAHTSTMMSRRVAASSPRGAFCGGGDRCEQCGVGTAG